MLLIASAIQAGMALLILLWLCCIRKRIAFTAAVLGQVARTLARLPELIVLQFVATVIAVGYACVCVLAALKANDLLDEHYESIGVPRSRWSHLALNIGAFLALAWGGLVQHAARLRRGASVRDAQHAAEALCCGGAYAVTGEAAPAAKAASPITAITGRRAIAFTSFPLRFNAPLPVHTRHHQVACFVRYLEG